MAYRINSRYNVHHEISAGSGRSPVFLVDDTLRGERPCALKVLRPPEDGDFTAARREFEILRSLRHPFIAEVYDFGRVETVEGAAALAGSAAHPGDFFITFSYLDGLDLRSSFLRLFPEGPQDKGLAEAEKTRRWRIFYEALAGIALGLHAIHSRGLIHRDIKPQNLLLEPHGTGPIPDRFAVKVIDLDLAEPETTPLGNRLRGTLPYMAPEILEGEFADGRSDLYSLGISILWAVSGRCPVPGESAEAVSRAISAGALDGPRDFCPGAPEDFLDLVGRLVRPRAAERIPDALTLVRELERIGGFSHAGSARVRAHIPMVGREQELSSIAARMDALVQGECDKSLILVESDEGSLCERFLAEAETAAQIRAVTWVEGWSRSPAGSAYPPILEALRKLIRRIRVQDPRYRRFRDLFALITGAAAGEAGDGGPGFPREKSQLFDEMAEFVLEAGREGPCVICLRGLHRSDPETLVLLEHLARNIALQHSDPEEVSLFTGTAGPEEEELPAAAPGGTASRILLLAEYEEEPSAESPPGAAHHPLAILASRPYADTLKLEPLAPHRTAEWVALRCPDLALPARLLQQIQDKSAGSPRLLDEIVRRLCRGEPSPGEREQDEMEVVLGLPDNLLDSILQRINQLGAPDRLLLDILSAQAPLEVRILERIREEFPGSLSEAAGQDEGGREITACLRNLVDEGFLILRDGAQGLEAAWTMESLREGLYRQLSEERRLQCHRALLNVLLPERDPPRGGILPEDLTFHAQKSGAVSLFLRFALTAAEGFRRFHQTCPAVQLLEEVLASLDLAPDLPDSLPGGLTKAGLRRSLSRSLGEIHRQRRDHSRAHERYAFLLTLEEQGADLPRRCEILRILGEISCQKRDYASGLSFLEKGLEALSGRPHSREEVETLLSLADAHLLRGHLQRAEATAQRALDVLEGIGAPELKGRAWVILAGIAQRQNDHSRSLSFHLRALEAEQGRSDPHRLLELTSAVGEDHFSLGSYGQAVEFFLKGLDLARAHGLKDHLAGFHNQLGILHFNRADHHRALESFRRSLRLRKELGDDKGIANCFNNIGLVFRVRDDLEKAARCYRKALDIFAHLDDQGGLAAGMNNLADILEMEGRYNEALQYAQLGLKKRKRSGSRMGMAFSYYRIGKIYQSKGEVEKARGFAEKGFELRRQAGDRMGTAYSRVQMAGLFLLEGRLLEAWQECQRAELEFDGIGNELGRMVAREIMARIHLEVGILDESKLILDDILARARKGGQQLLAGTSLLGLGRIALEEGRLADAQTLLGRAEGLFRDKGNRREHAEALLDSCILGLEAGRADRAAEVLQEAYGILEELGIRDLVPRYFLLRGRIEGESPGGSSIRVRKFLERSLVESRDLKLPGLTWQIHLAQAIQALREGDAASARGRLQEAEEILERQAEHLPPRFRERFFSTRERTRLEKLRRQMDEGSSRAPVPPSEPQPAAGAGSTATPPSGIRSTPFEALDAGQAEEVRSLDNRLRKQAFGEDDLRVLQTFSAQAAISIANARLSQEIQESNRELTEANRQMEAMKLRLISEVQERTAEVKATREKLERDPVPGHQTSPFPGLVGKSKRMQDIFHILERVSGTNLPVLIQGDSGTGKEIIANAIHRASPRRAGRFISENCAALSETILESELFGHNRGAFTGAVADRKGLFELAHGGTLFLDEVGDMSLTMQKKLLRVLEEGEIRRVGGKDTIRVDVRIISASNRNLRALAGAGKFREDLFYRLNGIQIDLPSLRERKDDIPLLVQHFLDSIARESHQSPKTVSPGALRLLLSYDWPGNVRELRHFLERTVLLAPGQRIEERDCLFDPVIFRQEGSVPQETLLPGIDELPLRSARDGFMKHYIERAYVRHGHNVTRAAQACGISRESFHRFLKRLRIKPKRERRGGDL